MSLNNVIIVNIGYINSKEEMNSNNNKGIGDRYNHI